jgi:hypothetical protein
MLGVMRASADENDASDVKSLMMLNFPTQEMINGS